MLSHMLPRGRPHKIGMASPLLEPRCPIALRWDVRKRGSIPPLGNCPPSPYACRRCPSSPCARCGLAITPCATDHASVCVGRSRRQRDALQNAPQLGATLRLLVGRIARNDDVADIILAFARGGVPHPRRVSSDFGWENDERRTW